MGRRALAVAAVLLATGCAALVEPRPPWDLNGVYEVGRPVLGYRWQKTVVDHTTATAPQEFADVAVAPVGPAEANEGRGAVYIGSHAGMLYALSPRDGHELWSRRIGSVSGEPVIAGDLLYVGTDDGTLIALTPETGQQRWQHQTKGAILRPPVVAGDTLLFSTDLDKVVALDRGSGKFRWQYERETPQEFTVHGHAGVAVADDRVFTGFADGHVVALSLAAGELLWVRSLAGEARQFVDVDTTPVVKGGVVYAASAAGGLYALSAADGTERWHLPMQNTAQLLLDDGRLFALAAEEGVYAVDLGGHILWRQGFRHGGDPARPVVDGNYLFVSYTEGGLFIVDKRDGTLKQSFNPGPGISASPAVANDQLYVMSNGGVLYAMNLTRF
jgi:outer membrane protein assembly factor BamB